MRRRTMDISPCHCRSGCRCVVFLHRQAAQHVATRALKGHAEARCNERRGHQVLSVGGTLISTPWLDVRTGVAKEVAGTRSADGRGVLGVVEGTCLQGETSASDAVGQVLSQRLKFGDAVV